MELTFDAGAETPQAARRAACDEENPRYVIDRWCRSRTVVASEMTLRVEVNFRAVSSSVLKALRRADGTTIEIGTSVWGRTPGAQGVKSTRDVVVFLSAQLASTEATENPAIFIIFRHQILLFEISKIAASFS